MATPPPTQISVQILKTMPYRGNTVKWGNRWFFNQTSLPSGSDMDAIAATMWAQEIIQYSSRVTALEAVWRAAGSEVPVRTSPITGSGSLPLTSKVQTPGDCAGVVRFNTTQRTSKNHPIYLFKYFHDVTYTSGADEDTINSTQLGRFLAYGNMMVTGVTQSSVTYKAAGPYGAVAQGVEALPLITHRDFPR